MQARGRRIRFTAVLAVMVLALTGFSQSRSHGHSRHSSSGGGGCSNSHQDQDSSSSGGSYDGSGYGSGSSGTGGTYHHRPTSTPTSGSGTAQPLQDATVKLISCATQKKPYATVEVTNPNDSKAEFEARVTFYDAKGTPLMESSPSVVPVSAKGKASARVALDERFLSSVDHCEANPSASPRS